MSKGMTVRDRFASKNVDAAMPPGEPAARLRPPPSTSPRLVYDANGLLPCVVQEWTTGEVLMVAYVNETALRKTLETGTTWFYSRSRQALWNKGETSGHVQRVRELRYDCDADCLLALVEQTGVACHTGTRSCFDRSGSSARPPAAARCSSPWPTCTAPSPSARRTPPKARTRRSCSPAGCPRSGRR